ncbi:MAG TPA: hypothetical protein VHI10_17825 [Mycobacterium sp.]|nr:hypothetical protein [Mycobacterium sp.]
MDSKRTWLRSPPAVALLTAAFVISLLLGTAFVAINHSSAAAGRAIGKPLTDDQAAAQVVNSAKEIVTVARLEQATGGYAFVSCNNETEPPYQAALYMNFRLPHSNWVQYLRDVASAMASHGWTDSPAMGEHFGHKLTKDGVTSIFHRNVNDAQFATMRIYGECRNIADHRNDNPAWAEITDQLG